MDITEKIQNAIEWANKRLTLQGQELSQEQKNYITFALSQNFTDNNQALQLQKGGVSNRLLAEKIILSLDDYGRKVHTVEYGLPIDSDTKDFEDKRPQEMLKIVIDILNGC